MSTKISDLRPDAAKAASRAIATLNGANVPTCVSSTLRTQNEQAALFAQGRESLEEVNKKRALVKWAPITAADNKNKVTNCDGVKFKSAHQSGLALDVVPFEKGRAVWPGQSDARWRVIAMAFIMEGFTWGGDWDGDGKTRYDGDLDEIMVDFPHYELRGKA